jgi:hypothetical protein
MQPSWCIFCCPRSNLLFSRFIVNFFNFKSLINYCIFFYNYQWLRMYLSPLQFTVRACRWYQELSMYTGGWYFCGPWRNVLIILFLYHFNQKNLSYLASAWTITHRLWMYVSAWLSRVRACIWYQQSSMYTGWWYFCGRRWILSLFVHLQHSMCKFSPILPVLGLSLIDFVCMYLHDFS